VTPVRPKSVTIFYDAKGSADGFLVTVTLQVMTRQDISRRTLEALKGKKQGSRISTTLADSDQG